MSFAFTATLARLFFIGRQTYIGNVVALCYSYTMLTMTCCRSECCVLSGLDFKVELLFVFESIKLLLNMTQPLFHAWLSTELLGRLPTLFIGRLVRCSTPGRSFVKLQTMLPITCAKYTNIFQGCSHQIWSDQVGSARTRMLYLGGPGGMLPQENFEI